jgi:hypothetical protein
MERHDTHDGTASAARVLGGAAPEATAAAAKPADGDKPAGEQGQAQQGQRSRGAARRPASAPFRGTGVEWLAIVLASALDHKLVDAATVLSQVGPGALAHHLPPGSIAKMLDACLDAGRMDPEILLRATGLTTVCRHLPRERVWAVVEEVAHRAKMDE